MSEIGFRIDGLNTKKNKDNAIPPIDFQHVLCEGATGSGKTASLILPTLSDRLRKGHTVIFFDHKGHEHKKVKALAKKIGRLKDVVEIGKPHSAYINLLAELDTIRLKEMVKDTGTKDPYWSNSAANLVEDIISPLRKLHDLMSAFKKYSRFTETSSTIIKSLEDIGIDIYVKPSFQTLSTIIASAQKLLKYKDVLSAIPNELENILRLAHVHVQGKDETRYKRHMLAKILSLKKSIEASERFTISEDKSDANSGNNAVLQTLDNTIASYAKKDYINIDEYSIETLMNSNAVIIIDTQSFGEDIMKLFLESILKKAVMRLRSGTEKPMSVFIDEANRVLFPSIDLHNDVLREAKVELILAIQNEEQMLNKFSETVWDSIKSNIKHQYYIDIEHRMTYNNTSVPAEYICLEDKVLMDADYLFYTLEKNHTNIQKNFLGTIDTLPDKFTVIYDLDRFEHESAILIEDKYGEQYSMHYHGESIVSAVYERYPKKEEAIENTYSLFNDYDIDISTEDTYENSSIGWWGWEEDTIDEKHTQDFQPLND